MITLSKISKNFGSRVLFEDVTITFNAGNRYGLTGPNGAGKTTLLKIIMGFDEATSGTVTLPNRVGILRQNIEAFKNEKVVDTVIMGNKRLWDAIKERDSLYEVEMSDDVGMRLGELEGIIAEEDGYSAEANAEEFLAGMGILNEYFNEKMHAVPTDIQFRVLLCQALFGEPQALLLDEPTNHLDLDSIGWLEKFLHNYKGTLIVISHDRHFLNSVTTHIADIDYETIIIYPGNYDEMVVAKTSVRERADADAKSKEKKISQLREFVARFGAGTRASQVQSRLREIERLQPQDLKKSNIQRPYIRFIPTEKAPGKILLKVEEISKSYDNTPVIKHFSMELDRGDKIGIIGSNGRGKTTLLKMLAQVLRPDNGQVELGHQVLISYFPQEHSDIVEKKGQKTAFDWLKERHPGIYDQEIRSVMGKLLFGGDDAFKPVATLSGGETARLILAGMLLSEHNLIILDEPNNHLDLEAVSALGWGLAEYKGTVVVASHDRDLISTVANKIIAFEPDGIHFFEGNLEEYLLHKSHS
ncbi:putative ABC transporter ATP-binding protein YbiT [Candidatus Protochlamydia amoebophila]|uniref:ABC-F family ATP-binding cassette domain-containing protein n=1 Tax=Candidatus Protochlamydia amoebophila TaxID=362787 RepID=UPI001BC95943|nr:ABC-F family ATP-binding cassette domain-containing protein [Candidatus Protochlamydia amoebophila]MBS4164241.1 putative ABC transporter ATP-binding protein YbiT [Candidatus Protochlamydia amoebophila]